MINQDIKNILKKNKLYFLNIDENKDINIKELFSGFKELKKLLDKLENFNLLKKSDSFIYENILNTYNYENLRDDKIIYSKTSFNNKKIRVSKAFKINKNINSISYD